MLHLHEGDEDCEALQRILAEVEAQGSNREG